MSGVLAEMLCWTEQSDTNSDMPFAATPVNAALIGLRSYSNTTSQSRVTARVPDPLGLTDEVAILPNTRETRCVQ